MSNVQSQLLSADDYLFREEPYLVKQVAPPKAPVKRKCALGVRANVVFRPKPIDPAVLRAKGELRAIKSQAAKISNDARQECSILLANAKLEIEVQRQKAVESGYSDGLVKGTSEGHEQGLRTGHDEGFTQWAELLTRWQSLLQQTIQKKEAFFADSEAILVHLAIEIAAKVLHREIKANPDAVLDLTRQAIHKATERSKLIIHLNPEDFAKAQNANIASFKMAEGVKHIEFLADEKVIAGGVLIETNTGIVDARLETQLVEIAKNLLEVASNGD